MSYRALDVLVLGWATLTTDELVTWCPPVDDVPLWRAQLAEIRNLPEVRR